MQPGIPPTVGQTPPFETSRAGGVDLHRQHQQPPNDDVCSSVSIDSSRTTTDPPSASKCSTELTGSCRTHTATDSGCPGGKMSETN